MAGIHVAMQSDVATKLLWVGGGGCKKQAFCVAEGRCSKTYEGLQRVKELLCGNKESSMEKGIRYIYQVLLLGLGPVRDSKR